MAVELKRPIGSREIKDISNPGDLLEFLPGWSLGYLGQGWRLISPEKRVSIWENNRNELSISMGVVKHPLTNFHLDIRRVRELFAESTDQTELLKILSEDSTTNITHAVHPFHPYDEYRIEQWIGKPPKLRTLLDNILLDSNHQQSYSSFYLPPLT